MSRSDLDRLRDACEFARHARDNAGGLAGEELAMARQPQHAALFDLIVIGEALNMVSPEVQSAAPHIPWRKIANLRPIIVHSYWQIDFEIIADVIEKHLEPLVTDLKALMLLVDGSQT
jgi:uncharacterized protein with HEPN domain